EGRVGVGPSPPGALDWNVVFTARGGHPVSAPLLLEYYDRLPQPRPGDDEELWAAGAQEPLREFRAAVRERYAEGTLQRLGGAEAARPRRAAPRARGRVGRMQATPPAAGLPPDREGLARRFAVDALGEIWSRGGSAEQPGPPRQAAREDAPVAARL